MKKFRLLSLALALFLMLTTFIGCDNDEKKENKKSTKSNSQVEESNIDTAKKPAVKDFSAGLTAEKIDSIDYRIYTARCREDSTGICYTNSSGKYGIRSFDGKKDTGAKYTYAEPLGEYFVVSTNETSATVDDMNCAGLIDINGKEILPMEYAGINKLNERYYQLYVATGTTTNKDDALIYSGSGLVYPNDSDQLFTGKWYIYDVIQRKMVKGATGTKAYAHYAKGDFIQYHLDDKTTVIVNHKGDTLPYSISLGNGVTLLNNGYYTSITNEEAALYNSNCEKLFDYNPDEGFKPMNNLGDDYFYASKYSDGKITYAVMDKSGKVVSPEFSSIPTLVGKYIFVDKKLCKIDGTPVVEGTFDSAKFDTLFKNTYFLYNGSELTCIDKDGNVIYKGVNRETSYFAIKDDLKQYYSFKDKDFTIKDGFASAVASWIVKKQNNSGGYDLIDTISGKTLLNGYDYYTCVVNENNTLYVYAETKDDTYDVYAIK